jgi:hypothetical protein
MEPTTAYPVQFSVDYPDRALNRVTTAFRIFVVILLIVLGAVSGGRGRTSDEDHGSGDGRSTVPRRC